MGLWKIWLVGLAITIVTSILIHTKAKIHKFFVDILVVVDIALVGGIAEGWAINLFCNEADYIMIVVGWILSILTAMLIWMVGALTLGIYKENQFRILEIRGFILVFIVASVCWAQLFINYNNNIEYINETVVVDEQENQLLYFCNIPIQQVSGSVSGSLSGSILWVNNEDKIFIKKHIKILCFFLFAYIILLLF